MTNYPHRIQIRTEGTVVSAYLVVPDEPEPMAFAGCLRDCIDADKQFYREWVNTLLAFVKRLLEKRYGAKCLVVVQKPEELN